MSVGAFVIFSIIYSAACAILDGLANRLIFRQNRKLSYFHPIKKSIYQLPEWTGFCMILLIFMGLVAPIAASFAMGGIQYVYLYLAIFCLIHWDMIFGKLVFDDWLGDLPSIRLPFFLAGFMFPSGKQLLLGSFWE